MKKKYIIILVVLIIILLSALLIFININKRTVIMLDYGQEYVPHYREIKITSRSDLKIYDEAIANMKYQHEGAEEMFGIIGGLVVTAYEIVGDEKIEYVFRTEGRTAKFIYDVKTENLKGSWMYYLDEKYLKLLRDIYSKYYYTEVE